MNNPKQLHKHLRGTACGNSGRQDGSEAIYTDLLLKEMFFKLLFKPPDSILSLALYTFILLAIHIPYSYG